MVDHADEVEEVEEVGTDQAEHVSLGYPTPSGWVIPSVGAPLVGHAPVGEPADMRKRKAPVDPDPIDLAGSDVPVVEIVTE